MQLFDSAKVEESFGKYNHNYSRQVTANEAAIYAEDEWNILSRTKMNVGLRLSAFNVQKKTYAALEPRLALSYLLTPDISVKAEYANVRQYIHLLSGNSLFLQTDLWVPVTKNIRPLYGLPLEIRINNALEAEIKIRDGYYEFAAGLKANDKIEIRILDESSETVKAQEIVPEPPVILSIDTIRFYDLGSLSTYMRTLIKIKDKPHEKNYYRLLIHRTKIYDWGTERETDYFVNQDIVLSNLSREGKKDDNNLSRIFPDDLFQGQEYTINVYFPVAPGSDTVKGKIEITVELQALNLYLRSLEQKWNSDIFDQPVKIYSNVSGGYGILEIYNSCKQNIIVQPSFSHSTNHKAPRP